MREKKFTYRRHTYVIFCDNSPDTGSKQDSEDDEQEGKKLKLQEIGLKHGKIVRMPWEMDKLLGRQLLNMIFASLVKSSFLLKKKKKKELAPRGANSFLLEWTAWLACKNNVKNIVSPSK